MKIRAGLVSNSSSSSFLLAIDDRKKLDLIEEAQRYKDLKTLTKAYQAKFGK